MTSETSLIRRVSRRKSSSKVAESSSSNTIRSYPSVQNLDTVTEASSSAESAPIHLYPSIRLIQPEAKAATSQVRRSKDTKITIVCPPEKRVTRDSWPPAKTSVSNPEPLESTSNTAESAVKSEHQGHHSMKEPDKQSVETTSKLKSVDTGVDVAVVKYESLAVNRNSPLISYKSSGCKITISASQRGKEFSNKHHPKKSNLKVTNDKHWTGKTTPKPDEPANHPAKQRVTVVRPEASSQSSEAELTAHGSGSGLKATLQKFESTSAQHHKFAIPDTFNFERLQRCATAVVSNLKEKQKKESETKDGKSNVATSLLKSSADTHEYKAKNLKRKFEHKFARASTFHSAFPRTSSPIRAVMENRLSLRNRKQLSTNAVQSYKKELVGDETKPSSSTLQRVKPVLRLKREQSHLPFQVSNTDNGNWTVKYEATENTEHGQEVSRPGTECSTAPSPQTSTPAEMVPPPEILSALPEVLLNDKPLNTKKKSSRKSMESGTKCHDNKKKKSRHDECIRMDKHKSHKHSKGSRSSKHRRSHSAPAEKLSTLKRSHSIRLKLKDVPLLEKLKKCETQESEVALANNKVLLQEEPDVNDRKTLKNINYADKPGGKLKALKEAASVQDTCSRDIIEDVVPVNLIQADEKDNLTQQDSILDKVPSPIKVTKISKVTKKPCAVDYSKILDSVMKGTLPGDTHDDFLKIGMEGTQMEAVCEDQVPIETCEDGAAETKISRRNLIKNLSPTCSMTHSEPDLLQTHTVQSVLDLNNITLQSSPKRKRTYSSTLSLASTGSQDELVCSAFKRVRPSSSQSDVILTTPSKDQSVTGQLLGEVVLMSSRYRQTAGDSMDTSKASSVSDILRPGLCTSHQEPATAPSSDGEDLETNLKAVEGCIERLERDLALDQQEDCPGVHTTATATCPSQEPAEIKVEPGKPLRVVGHVTYLSDLPGMEVEVKEENAIENGVPLHTPDPNDARNVDSEETLAYSQGSDVSAESLPPVDLNQVAKEQKPLHTSDHCDVTSSSMLDAHVPVTADGEDRMQTESTEASQDENVNKVSTLNDDLTLARDRLCCQVPRSPAIKRTSMDTPERLPSSCNSDVNVTDYSDASNNSDDDAGDIPDDKPALQVNRPSSTTKCCPVEQASHAISCRMFKPVMNPEYQMLIEKSNGEYVTNEPNCKQAFTLDDSDVPIHSIILRKVVDKMHSDMIKRHVANMKSDKPDLTLLDSNGLSAEEVHALRKKNLLSLDSYNELYPQILTIMPVHGTAHDDPSLCPSQSPSPEVRSPTQDKTLSPAFPDRESHSTPRVQRLFTPDYREQGTDKSQNFQNFVSMAPATAAEAIPSQVHSACISTVEIAKTIKMSKSRKKRKSKSKVNDFSASQSDTASTSDYNAGHTSSTVLSTQSSASDCPPPPPPAPVDLPYFPAQFIPRFPFSLYPAIDPSLPFQPLPPRPLGDKEGRVQLLGPSNILSPTSVMTGQFPPPGNLQPGLGQPIMPPWALIPRYAFNTSAPMSSAYMGSGLQTTTVTSAASSGSTKDKIFLSFAPFSTLKSSPMPNRPLNARTPDSKAPSPEDRLVIDMNDDDNSTSARDSTSSSWRNAGAPQEDNSRDSCKTTASLEILFRTIEAATASNNDSKKSVGTAGTWFPPAGSSSNNVATSVRPGGYQFSPGLSNVEVPPVVLPMGQHAAVTAADTYTSTSDNTPTVTASAGSVATRTISSTKRDSILYKAILRQVKKPDTEDLPCNPQFLRQGVMTPAKPSEELKRLLVRSDLTDTSRAKRPPAITVSPNVVMTLTAAVAGPVPLQPSRPASSTSSELDVVRVSQTDSRTAGDVVSSKTEDDSNSPLDLRQPQRHGTNTTQSSVTTFCTQTSPPQSTIREIQTLLESLQKTIDGQVAQIQTLQDQHERACAYIAQLESQLEEERQLVEQLESHHREKQ